MAALLLIVLESPWVGIARLVAGDDDNAILALAVGSTLFVIFLLLGFGLAVWIAPHFAPGSRYAPRRRTAGGEAVLGPRGVSVSGRFGQLVAPGLCLSAVRVEPGTPTVLHFEVHRPTRWGVERQDTRVPVPHGRRGEAETLAGRYRTEYGAHPSAS